MEAPTPTVDEARLEAEIRSVGRELVDGLPSAALHPMRAIDERAMRLSTEDAELRTALFRLVDVTPACRSLDDLAEHLRAFADELDDRPAPLDVAIKAARTKPGRLALGAAVSAGVRHMAHRFIAGESPEEALGELRRLWDAGIGSTVDLLGEATLTSEEADALRRALRRGAEDARRGVRPAARSAVARARPGRTRCRAPTSRSRSRL